MTENKANEVISYMVENRTDERPIDMAMAVLLLTLQLEVRKLKEQLANGQ